jgi:hypothetical protein
MHRDGWSVHCLAADARTPISPRLEMAKESTILRPFRASGATDETIAEVEADIRRWRRGSVWLEVSEEGKKLLRLRM